MLMVVFVIVLSVGMMVFFVMCDMVLWVECFIKDLVLDVDIVVSMILFRLLNCE